MEAAPLRIQQKPHATRPPGSGPAERYDVRLAAGANDLVSALRLRHEVFNVELGSGSPAESNANLEFDAFDFKCRHLLVIDRQTGETVGTYRLNSIESARDLDGFYSSGEFDLSSIPDDIIEQGIEIGRACVARSHRNSKVLFKLWQGLISELRRSGKRYYFGCCSIFTQDPSVGRDAYLWLADNGHVEQSYQVSPRRNAIDVDPSLSSPEIKLPDLFNMYLRLGAKVCGPPMIDTDFGTIDFFVVFDASLMSDKYRKLLG